MSDYPSQPDIAVVMPAYNAAKTLEKTLQDIPRNIVNDIILVDDGSRDDTIQIAKQLGLKVFSHQQNFGYGANQKTCYSEALKTQAQIIVMVHPDYQYDPTLLPDIVAPICENKADVVFGSRMMGTSAYRQGMPLWKYIPNKFLTWLENVTFGLRLSEFHTGYRAYHRRVLEQINFRANSDGFIFDQEIVAQIVLANFRITDISVPVRYFPEASSASFLASTRYGLGILALLLRFVLHRTKILPSMQLEAFGQRYRSVE